MEKRIEILKEIRDVLKKHDVAIMVDKQKYDGSISVVFSDRNALKKLAEFSRFSGEEIDCSDFEVLTDYLEGEKEENGKEN